MSEKDNLPDFTGKCISMSLHGDQESHDLNNPRFEYQGGQLFIVGTIPRLATDSGRSANQTGAVAWSQVRNYVLFENLSEYERAVAISETYDPEYEEVQS